jgi:hypothetical protein
MFAYAFNRCLAYSLKTRCSVPKGTEIAAFPNIAADAKEIGHHEHKHQIYLDYPENPRTVENENDNMSWHIEKQFQGGKIESFGDNLTIQKILSIPNVDKKWLVTLGNFETGNQYLPYRGQLKEWFRFPSIDHSKFEFFKLAPNREDYFISSERPEIDKDDLVISFRLEDYTTSNNKDRLLDFDYFKIILESKKFNKLVIITNPGCINHQEFYYKFFDEFREYDPITNNEIKEKKIGFIHQPSLAPELPSNPKLNKELVKKYFDWMIENKIGENISRGYKVIAAEIEIDYETARKIKGYLEQEGILEVVGSRTIIKEFSI